MADLAVTFHWGPSDLAGLDIDDLVTWRERARVRHSESNKT